MNNKNIINIFNILALLLLFVLVVFPLQASAAKQQPISITADEMMSTQKNSQVVFKGDVDAKQGDIRIRTDKMTVHYTAPEADGGESDNNVKQQIEKIVCVGNVEITREDWLGTSKTMTYSSNKQQIRLSGNAKAWQGQNVVNGEEIIYYIDEGRSEVIGGTTTTITPDGEKKKKRVNMTIIQQ